VLSAILMSDDFEKFGRCLFDLLAFLGAFIPKSLYVEEALAALF
jgi:hypothetical protein